MKEYNLHIEQLKQYTACLKAGDRVLLSGNVYTARDAAHKRLMQALKAEQTLPIDLKGSVLYYAGPTPAHGDLPIGSCGPTTSGRMDVYTPDLLDRGLLGMIGKGERSPAVCEAILRNQAVYFCAVGGAGALAAKHITDCTVIAYEDLGCESIKRLAVKDFPVTVAVDCHGGNLFLRSNVYALG